MSRLSSSWTSSSICQLDLHEVQGSEVRFGMPWLGCRNAAGAWMGTYVRSIARDEAKDFRIAGKLLFSLLDFLSTWRKDLPTANTAVRMHARASLWCPQVVNPQLIKTSPTFKTTYRRYLQPTISAKILRRSTEKYCSDALFCADFLWKCWR